MDKVTLTLEPREVVGKHVKYLRRDGLVPAVIHDHGKDSIVVAGDYVAMVKAYQQAGRNQPVEVSAGGKKYMTLIKSVTFDPRKNQLNHVVFGAVKANEKVTAEVPVHMTFDEGNDITPAERASLVVLTQLDTVEVEALPNELPGQLTFDGEKLVEVGDQATVADLVVPKNVTIKTEETQVLATVFEPSALAAANDAAGGAEEEAPAAEGEEAPATDTKGETIKEEK